MEDYTKEQLGLKSILGCGTALLPSAIGHFRKRTEREALSVLGDCDDISEVCYKFFTLLFLPIVPLGCYRVQTYSRACRKVIGKESARLWEVLCVYIGYYTAVVILIAALLHFVYRIE